MVTELYNDLEILENRVLEESKYKDTLTLLADYYNMLSTNNVKAARFNEDTMTFILKKSNGTVTVFFDIVEGYVIKGPYRDTTVAYITGNSYLDMMTLYRKIEEL